MRYVLWGHGNSWIVHLHDGVRIIWESRWFHDKCEAEALLDRLEGEAPAP